MADKNGFDDHNRHPLATQQHLGPVAEVRIDPGQGYAPPQGRRKTARSDVTARLLPAQWEDLQSGAQDATPLKQQANRLGGGRLVPRRFQGVITSYSIHYTKLYDKGEVINLGSRQEVKIRDLAERVIALTNSRSTIELAG